MKKSLGPGTYALPCPVWIIGAYDENEKPNVMAAAWSGICCSKPPCLCVSLRAATYTHGCIHAAGAFSVNIPGEAHLREADYFGMASGREVDKFARSGLTAAPSDAVYAPIVKEFPLVLECKLLTINELGLHTQFIGEVVDVKAEENVLNEKGRPDFGKIRPFCFSAGDHRSYYATGEKLADAYSVGASIETNTR